MSWIGGGVSRVVLEVGRGVRREGVCVSGFGGRQFAPLYYPDTLVNHQICKN